MFLDNSQNFQSIHHEENFAQTRAVVLQLIPNGTSCRQGLNQIKLAHDPMLTVSAFNLLCQYASSPGNREFCDAEPAICYLAVAVTTASTHCAYPQRVDPEAK